MKPRVRSDDRSDDSLAPPAGRPGAAARVLTAIIERGARAQAPAIRAYVRRLRDADPDASPAEIVGRLEKHYLAAVTASGAAVGSTAAVPGIGTLAALSAVTGETVVFLEATTVFVLSVAEVYGIGLHERQRRRAAVLSVLVGEDSKGAVGDLLGRRRLGGAWITEGAATLPVPALAQLNSRLLRHFLKRFTLRRGALAFGKALPMGIGAAVGGVGNRLMGKKIVGNARKAFGPPPQRWPSGLQLVPPPTEGQESDAPATPRPNR
ncbi:hypothetical protein [uncultured Mycolicibacterium sp.]|uniref:hypothetical protein n=1 Tax=uncultured Mycolicibacterium sp. TaxID=2320817 RepID=UPI00260C81C8|nr:hypothetical protein [uncultured Mycolicibacterium sp.]